MHPLCRIRNYNENPQNSAIIKLLVDKLFPEILPLKIDQEGLLLHQEEIG